ncbi:hypothetical protein J8M97_16470 [Gordonia polyisoprenivorans]|uniref:hypothetical protein n=1 Tax=Gordonia polyisoprenivorans TaxID=84595 RepID=UPI001B8CE304|nr:hypothetical protein [Gordonia polyisoprenivorans]QUD81388.1 hypothetical protein J8M97_16470 [Gordonia polyisoprenivorans]
MATPDTEQDAPWAPFGLDADEAVEYSALREDIPPWLAPSLWEWIAEEFTSRSSSGYESLRVELLRESERVLRKSVGFSGDRFDREIGLVSLLASYSTSGPKPLWRLVDFCLSKSTRYQGNPRKLESLLLDSGAAWTVGLRAGKPGLVRRVPEGVAVAAEAVFAKGDAGARLRTAWEKAFGVDPEPDVAYSRAVKAVEDAAIPVVSGNDKAATLGKVIAQIRDGGQFALPMMREHKDAPSHDVLLGMLQLLWTGQHDRHGGNPLPSTPSVTQDEAEAAVLLAVTLVGWFETGKVRP